MIRCLVTRKVCFATRTAAKRAARRRGTHGHAYRCKHCGTHHWTSQPPAVRRTILYLLESLK